MSIAQNWIGGAWTGSGAIRDSVDPATGEVIGRYADAGLEDAERAIAAARRAFLETTGRAMRICACAPC